MNTATQAGVIASAGAALPLGGLIFWADITQLTYTPTASLPGGEQSPGTLGRIDTLVDQYGGGPAFTATLNSTRAYLYGTGGGSGAPLKWGQRNAGVGGSNAGIGPRRVAPVPSVWHGNYSFFARYEILNGNHSICEVFNPAATSDNIRFLIASGGTTISHLKSTSGSSYTVTSSAGSVAIGSRYSLGMSFDNPSNTTSFYVNGVFKNSAVGSVPVSHTWGVTTEEWIHARAASSANFPSMEVAYSRVLTAAEHLALHNHALTIAA